MGLITRRPQRRFREKPSPAKITLVKKIRPGVERLKDLVTGDAMTMAVEANVTSLNKIYEAV